MPRLFTKQYLKFIATLVIAVLLLWGCNGSAPVLEQITDLPLAPELETFEGTTETQIDTILLALAATKGFDFNNYDVFYYYAKADTDWETVAQFYRTALSKEGWAEYSTLALTSRMVAFQRNSIQGEQQLVFSAIPFGERDGTDFLVMVVLYSPFKE